MNTQHQTFLLEYFRTGDKKQAYRKAYPQAKENCITNSVNRLLARPDIAEAIREQEQTKRKDLEAEIAERYKAEIIDFYEAQAYLSQIIRGTFTREKAVKQKDGWTTITVTPTISETLRALSIFLKAPKAPSNSPQGGGQDQHNQSITFPPPWGEPEGAPTAPHPFGNIYPANYPGPYYDPDDPNTKDKLQNLRLNRLTDSPVTTTTSNNNQGRHSERREESPEPLQAAQSRETGHITSTPPVIAGKNDEKQQQTTTIHNKVPPSGGGGGIPPYGSDGHYAAKQRAWRIKLEQLRKEGWETASELSSEVYNTYLVNQHSGTYKMLKQFEKALQSRNLPAEEREKIIQETGWEYHPEHPHVMRRRRKLNS